LWVMKVVLRWFELASGLKVRFSTSRLSGVNYSFISMASVSQL